MEEMTGLNVKIREMARRIRELREIEGYTPEEMAQRTDLTAEEYLRCENGDGDLNFAFLYRCAIIFKVDVTDLIEGYSPKLQSYTVTRHGAGQEIAKAHGMTYYNLAYDFKNRIAEPLFVRMDYDPEAEKREIELTTHEGQECDLVVEGHLMVQVGDHREVLGPGDSIYYDSNAPHGMVAVQGTNCVFYAIVLNPSGEPLPEFKAQKQVFENAPVRKKDTEERVWQNFIDVTETETGTPTSIRFKNTDRFNFAFDIVDAIAAKDPDKQAMLHISKDKTERRFTFRDMMRESNRCANYFKWE